MDQLKWMAAKFISALKYAENNGLAFRLNDL